jgi:hypothetical protein
MHKLPIYIYETGYTLFSDLDGAVKQGYTPMYQKDIQVVKGVTNTLKFTVKNQDQKPLDISGETLTFNLVNKETGAVHLQVPCVTVDDGSTVATRGVATLTLTESDTASLVSKFYKFSVTRTIGGSGNHVTYANTYYEVAGTIEIVDHVYPAFTDSTKLPNTDFVRPLTSSFYSPNGQITEYFSSLVDAQPEYKRNGALHTITYYSSNYVGDLTIQATLDSQVTSDTSWVDLTTINLTSSDSIGYQNVTGVYNYFRLKHLPDNSNTGTLDKVLVRS